MAKGLESLKIRRRSKSLDLNGADRNGGGGNGQKVTQTLGRFLGIRKRKGQ